MTDSTWVLRLRNAYCVSWGSSSKGWCCAVLKKKKKYTYLLLQYTERCESIPVEPIYTGQWLATCTRQAATSRYQTKQVRVILETYEESVMNFRWWILLLRKFILKLQGVWRERIVGSNSHSTLLSQVDLLVSKCNGSHCACQRSWSVGELKKISVRCRAAFKPPANAR